MSEQTAPTTGTEETNEQSTEAAKEFQAITSQEDFDKAIQARIARERAKFTDYDELKTAKVELDKIRESQKSESEKVAERLAAAEKAATEAEAKVLRRDIAIEHKLSADDAALLDTITDEEAMRALAARLATAADATAGARTPRPDPNQGKTGTAPASTGDQFAAFFTSQLGG